jgi:hypothetical protein
MGFFGCKSGERKRALGEKRAFVGYQTGLSMTRGTHSTIIDKTATEKIRVVLYNVGNTPSIHERMQLWDPCWSN